MSKAEGVAHLNSNKEVSVECLGGRYRGGCRIVVEIPVDGGGEGKSYRVTVKI